MDESEPLTAAQIAERKQDRLEQARIHVAHVKRECTPDSPMYSARDFARMIRAVECIEGEIDRALLHVEQLQSENATLHDRLAQAEAQAEQDNSLILWQRKTIVRAKSLLFRAREFIHLDTDQALYDACTAAIATPTDGAAGEGDAT